MDYEKKYKEAFAWIRDIYPTLTGAAKEDAEHYFPELRESEDERIRKAIISALKFANDGGVYEKHIAYLEKQKEQKPVEWSEEDEKMLWSAINGLNIHIYEKERAWLANKLKSLRPQPSWKPRDEQMDALYYAFHGGELSPDEYVLLTSLYEQLQKL